jgi:hypothetical protein
MESPAMDRFETVLNFALDLMGKGTSIEDTKAEILKAADQLLEDAAMEMAEATVNGICLTLLQIHRNGRTPGKALNPLLDQLQDIVANAGHLKNDDDHSAQDTY